MTFLWICELIFGALGVYWIFDSLTITKKKTTEEYIQDRVDLVILWAIVLVFEYLRR